MSALESSPTLRWERREKDEKEMPASERRVYRQLARKLVWIDRADLRCAMEKAPSSLGRAADNTQSGSCEKSTCGLSVDV